MTNSNSGDLVQQTRAETDATAERVFARHRVRFVTRTHLAHGFVCSCGGTFPYLGDQLRKHFYDQIGEAAEAMGAVPHPSWGGFAKPETDAPAPSPAHDPFASIVRDARDGFPSNRKYAAEVADWCQRELDAAKTTGDQMGRAYVQNVVLIIEALREYAKANAPAGSPEIVPWNPAVLRLKIAEPLIADLASLLRSDSYPAHVGTATLARAEAFLHGDERITNEQFDAMLPPGARDPELAIGGAIEDAEINHQAMQEILINAIDAFEGFEKFAVGFLAGKGFDEPEVSLQHMIFGAQS